MSEYVENAKFKFAKAKYYYEQMMKINFQDMLENVISESGNGYQWTIERKGMSNG